MANTILNVTNVTKRFGGLQALGGVNMHIEEGQVYGLIGPNGAGKTTFFNVITGLYEPDTGTFELGGQAYEPTAVHTVAQAGIARTFQNIRVFAEMTALENVMVGRHIRTKVGPLGSIFRTRAFREEEAAIRQRAFAGAGCVAGGRPGIGSGPPPGVSRFAAHRPDHQGVRPAAPADAPERRGAVAHANYLVRVGHEL